jgi:hypothetical protein
MSGLCSFRSSLGGMLIFGFDGSVVIRVQMLSELEEIIAYKDHADQPERQATQRRTWQRRSAVARTFLL